MPGSREESGSAAVRSDLLKEIANGAQLQVFHPDARLSAANSQ